MSLSLAISFRSERFDYVSDLPPTCNAGNRFYGQEVAAFLADALAREGLAATYFDEDWGWLVSSVRGQSPEWEIAVYNLAEHGEGGKPGIGAWGLWIRCYRSGRWLGLPTRRTEIAVPAAIVAAVESAIRSVGSVPEIWPDGPEGE